MPPTEMPTTRWNKCRLSSKNIASANETETHHFRRNDADATRGIRQLPKGLGHSDKQQRRILLLAVRPTDWQGISIAAINAAWRMQVY